MASRWKALAVSSSLVSHLPPPLAINNNNNLNQRQLEQQPSSSSSPSPRTNLIPLPHPSSSLLIPPHPSSSFPSSTVTMISPTDQVSTELSTAVRSSRTLLANSLQHNHGTPCMHLLAFHIFSSSTSPRFQSIDALYALAECENGQIPGMCILGNAYRDGIPGALAPSPPRAASLWRKAVSAYGCALSSYLLACAAEHGDGVERRPALAAVLYESALLAEGFGFAAAGLAKLLEDGADGVEKDVSRAVRLYEFAVRKGSTEAIGRLVRILKDGRVGVVPKGIVGAVALLEQAAREGNSGQAMTALAAMLEEGTQCVGCDPERAMALYEHAVEHEEDVQAMISLARMLLEGRVEKDVPKAVETLEKAIDCGSTMAVWKLADVLIVEDEVRNEQRACELLTELIEHDDYTIQARMEIAWLLSGNAQDLPPDVAKAAELYDEVLRECEDVDAIFALADLLLKGRGNLPPNPLRAISLYERAVTVHEHVQAMNELGLVYYNGLGRSVPKDLHKAIELFELAAGNGSVDAKYYLARTLTVGTGRKNEPLDLERGMDLYEEIIETIDHLWSMINLARCLVPCEDDDMDEQKARQQVTRAASILERAIRIGLQNSEGELRPLGIVPEARFCLKHDEASHRIRERGVSKGAHIVAMVNLAELLVLNAEPKNVYKAVRLLERALRDFEVPSAFDSVTFNFQVLTEVLQEANGDEALCRRVAQICQLFIERTGKTEPMCVLADMLVHGTGIRRSAEDAVRCYDKAISEGNKKAMLALGELLRTGAPGVKADRRKSFSLLTRVLAEGAPRAIARTAVVDLALLCSQRCSQQSGLKS